MRWLHPNPRKRIGMEIARFAVYLSVPVVVITVCSDPANMNRLLRGFKFVEYPPEAKKLPSSKDIVKMMEDREAKRRKASIAASRAGMDSHLAAAGANKPSSPPHAPGAPGSADTSPPVVESRPTPLPGRGSGEEEAGAGGEGGSDSKKGSWWGSS